MNESKNKIRIFATNLKQYFKLVEKYYGKYVF